MTQQQEQQEQEEESRILGVGCLMPRTIFLQIIGRDDKEVRKKIKKCVHSTMKKTCLLLPIQMLVICLERKVSSHFERKVS